MTLLECLAVIFINCFVYITDMVASSVVVGSYLKVDTTVCTGMY